VDCEARDWRRADISRAERAASTFSNPSSRYSRDVSSLAIAPSSSVDSSTRTRFTAHAHSFSTAARSGSSSASPSPSRYLVHRRAWSRVNGESAGQRLDQDARVRPRAGRHVGKLGAHPASDRSILAASAGVANMRRIVSGLDGKRCRIRVQAGTTPAAARRADCRTTTDGERTFRCASCRSRQNRSRTC
jgi:hypothetical protein